MEKLKDCLRIITIIAIVGYLSYCVFLFVTTQNAPTYVDSGVIVSKSNDEVVIRHGTKTELYLNVQFDKSGFRSMEATPTDYFKFKVGQRVTYELYSSVSMWFEINWIMGSIASIVCVFLLVVLFFCWLFN